MLGHPGGEEHSSYLIELSFLPPPARWLDMGAGDGSTVRLLQSLGYEAEGIDLNPRGDDVTAGDYLQPHYPEGSFDGILSQCSFYVSGNVPEALRQAGWLLRKGGKLVFSDVTEDVVQLLNQVRQAGFAVRHLEDLTEAWKEYYLEALWTQDNVCLPRGKKVTYTGFPVLLLGLSRMYGRPLPICRALVSGDACPKGVMDALERELGSKLYPHYGSRECGLGGAVTCPAFEGMHLRENHIIPEIVDEGGRVLPEGEYGELVITTIGMEAMPLIRYRTGDFTRILPPCPCGGVTRRIDTVSRREGEISMERLDSALFSLETLVDYRAAFDGTLHIDARTVDGQGRERLTQAANDCCPGRTVMVRVSSAEPDDRPMYLGKRYVQ